MTDEFKIDLQIGKGVCTDADACHKLRDRFMERMVGKYVELPGQQKAKLITAAVDLNRFQDMESYLGAMRKVHKGAALRQSRKADKEGFHCKQFAWKNHIPDVVDINTSMDVRSGGVMKEAYNRGVEEMGGAPTREHKIDEPVCPAHHTYCWGVFKPEEGYKQGEIVTNEKLIAYIKFKRNGNFALYTSILGHGDFLQFGIMHRLHLTIMEWIFTNPNNYMTGLEYVAYGAIDSGTEGLQQWKKRALFEGGKMILKVD